MIGVLNLIIHKTLLLILLVNCVYYLGCKADFIVLCWQSVIVSCKNEHKFTDYNHFNTYSLLIAYMSETVRMLLKIYIFHKKYCSNITFLYSH